MEEPGLGRGSSPAHPGHALLASPVGSMAQSPGSGGGTGAQPPLLLSSFVILGKPLT